MSSEIQIQHRASNMANKIQWRVAPPLHLAEAVRKLAMSEGRSDTNMITRLIAETVSTRRALDQRKPELVRLVEIIRGDRQAR